MNTNKPENPSAFPNKGMNNPKLDGMTLRDYFAAKALQGFCANPSIFQISDQSGWRLVNCTDAQLASLCLVMADAMLTEGSKK